MTESSIPRIIIIMGTYNGAEYLHAQIDSLIGQTVTDWVLLARDDGSEDLTPDILKHYSKKDRRIQLCANDGSRLSSALGNFAVLLGMAAESDAEYIFSCDQDDVWAPQKLEMILASLQQLEGPDKTACLVHHDLIVVDDHLNVIRNSFIEMMKLTPKDETNPQRLISRNEVTGCAMACNRALLKLALPISDKAVMHDWWLGLFAAYFGKLRFEPTVLVQYRQHDTNVIGAKTFFHGLNPFTNWVKGWRRGDREFMETVEQAQAFRQALVGRDIDLKSKRVLDLYCSLPASPRLQRIKSLRECNLWRTHWLLNVMLILRMLLLPKLPEQ